jgi:hypothetical protein
LEAKFIHAGINMAMFDDRRDAWQAAHEAEIDKIVMPMAMRVRMAPWMGAVTALRVGLDDRMIGRLLARAAGERTPTVAFWEEATNEGFRWIAYKDLEGGFILGNAQVIDEDDLVMNGW